MSGHDQGAMMSRRIDSELLLVGSLPAGSTEEALRAGGELFGDLVFALPDGETGPRETWTAYECFELLMPNPGIEVVNMPDGMPRHAYGIADVIGLRDGVSEVRFDSWPRIDDAIESYALFCELREQGVIPANVRFQVSLPFATSVLCSLADFRRSFPIVSSAYEELVTRELARLFEAIPPHDLAVQWDVCWEVLDGEDVVSWMGGGEAWERFAGPVRRLTPLVPEDALVGFHLCYGTMPSWPMYEARDLALLVKMANYAIDHAGRRVDWLHLAGPR